MQNAAFVSAGINAAYVAFPVDPARLETAVAGLCAAGIRGFNLTVPHKQKVLPLLDEITPQAQAIGAVNTVRADQGRLLGTNTDGQGLLSSLEEDLAFDPRSRRVLILGAGGSARAIAFALLDAGAGHLVIANRTPERAALLAEDCRQAHPERHVESCRLEQLEGLAPDLLIQTTTVGMKDGSAPVDLAGLQVREAVCDIIYSPPETPLLAQARRLGLRTANGMGMLLHQGAAAWTFWTGKPAPLEAMRTALRQAIQQAIP